MTTQSIALTVAAMLLGTVACQQRDQDRLERKAEDVQQAREDVREAKTELQEQKAELTAEVRRAMGDAETRFELLNTRAKTITDRLEASGVDMSTGVGAEILQARMLAKAKMEAARTTETPEQQSRALVEAKDALDTLERRLDDYERGGV